MTVNGLCTFFRQFFLLLLTLNVLSGCTPSSDKSTPTPPSNQTSPKPSETNPDTSTKKSPGEITSPPLGKAEKIVLSKPATNDDGSLQTLSFQKANEFCNGLEQRLPTAREAATILVELGIAEIKETRYPNVTLNFGSNTRSRVLLREEIEYMEKAGYSAIQIGDEVNQMAVNFYIRSIKNNSNLPFEKPGFWTSSNFESYKYVVEKLFDTSNFELRVHVGGLNKLNTYCISPTATYALAKGDLAPLTPGAQSTPVAADPNAKDLMVNEIENERGDVAGFRRGNCELEPEREYNMYGWTNPKQTCQLRSDLTVIAEDRIKVLYENGKPYVAEIQGDWEKRFWNKQVLKISDRGISFLDDIEFTSSGEVSAGIVPKWTELGCGLAVVGKAEFNDYSGFVKFLKINKKHPQIIKNLAKDIVIDGKIVLAKGQEACFAEQSDGSVFLASNQREMNCDDKKIVLAPRLVENWSCPGLGVVATADPKRIEPIGVGHHFSCENLDIFLNTDVAGGIGSSVWINGMKMEMVFASISNLSIYKTHLALAPDSPLGRQSGNVYFFSKKDLQKLQLGKKYDIHVFKALTVGLEDEHKTLACEYRGKTK